MLLASLARQLVKTCAPRSRKLLTSWVGSFRGPHSDLPVGRSKAVQRGCTVGLGRVFPTGGAVFNRVLPHSPSRGGRSASC